MWGPECGEGERQRRRTEERERERATKLLVSPGHSYSIPVETVTSRCQSSHSKRLYDKPRNPNNPEHCPLTFCTQLNVLNDVKQK